MSQKRTVIQGLEPDDSPQYGNQNNGGGNSGFYSRRERPAGNGRGTYVPGMGSPAPNSRNDSGYAGQQGGSVSAQPDDPVRKFKNSGKPVVGFLYSVSRTPVGEFWPLQMGQNTIGKNPSCDIQLPEGTVSDDHAVLVVRRMKNPDKVIASISDARSTNGTMLNGHSLGFSAEECSNGDIITIGDNYELYLILVDPASLGLHVAPDFIPVATEPEEEEESYGPVPGGYTRPGGFNPGPPHFNGGGTAGSESGGAGRGTVGMDGSFSGGNKGGTMGF